MVNLRSIFEDLVGFAPRQTWQRVARMLGTGFGFGYVPFMPGTVGSLWGLPLVWILQALFGKGFSISFAICAVVIFVAGIGICHRARQDFQKEDPGQIVFDEIAAFPIVFLFTPISWTTALMGFVWFRLFDIVKPWPIKRLEKLPGGLGIMIDDAMAGVYAAAALAATVYTNSLLQPVSA